MELKLKPIELIFDGTNEIYSSENMQILIKSYKEFYKEIGYVIPSIGYFAFRETKL